MIGNNSTTTTALNFERYATPSPTNSSTSNCSVKSSNNFNSNLNTEMPTIHMESGERSLNGNL